MFLGKNYFTETYKDFNTNSNRVIMSTVVSVVPVPWIAALAWNHVSKYGVSVLG